MDYQKNYLPKELLSLISMLIQGTDHTEKLSQATLTCAQLIVFNYKPNNTGAEDKTTKGFSQIRDTPLVYSLPSIYMDGFALNVLLPISFKGVFQFLT